MAAPMVVKKDQKFRIVGRFSKEEFQKLNICACWTKFGDNWRLHKKNIETKAGGV
jgi:hypothetical protein